MSSQTTRRTAIAASATLPLLPLASYATPTDPAVEAYRVWRAAYDAFEGSFDRPDIADDDSIVKAAHGEEMAARRVLSDAVATTPAGIACQVKFAFGVFGELKSNDHSTDNPDDFEFDGWIDDLQGRLLRAMLAGAEGMANA
jgi:hypothetical protein